VALQQTQLHSAYCSTDTGRQSFGECSDALAFVCAEGQESLELYFSSPVNNFSQSNHQKY